MSRLTECVNTSFTFLAVTSSAGVALAPATRFAGPNLLFEGMPFEVCQLSRCLRLGCGLVGFASSRGLGDALATGFIRVATDGGERAERGARPCPHRHELMAGRAAIEPESRLLSHPLGAFCSLDSSAFVSARAAASDRATSSAFTRTSCLRRGGTHWSSKSRPRRVFT